MAYLKIKNRAVSALAADITSTATSLTVTTDEGAKFPATGDFHITIEDEILKCTARTTDTLTVTRAAEGTTAAAHITGKSVELRITAGIIESRTTWTADKLLKGAGAGVNPTEIDVPSGGATIVRKITDETVNGVFPLQNDDELYFAVAANETWQFFLCIRATRQSGGAQTTRFAFSVPSGGSISKAYTWGKDPTTGDGTASESWTGSTVAQIELLGFYLYIGGANAGNVQFQFSINSVSPEAYDHTVKANSFILAHKLA